MKIIYAIGALAALILSPVYAACVMPDPPASIADGATASATDMIASQKAVLAYNDAAKAYLGCIRKEQQAAVAAAGEQISTVQRDKIDSTESQKENAAVGELNGIVSRFNEQMRIFQARNANAATNSSKADSKKN